MKICTIKRLLCGCICWLVVVGSTPLVVGGQWSVVGTSAFATRQSTGARRNPQVYQEPQTGHRPPTTDHLPCADSSPACLHTLGDLAVRHNLEIRTLDHAIQLARKKQWTTWLNADGLNPIAMGLRIVRNVAGGGDRAALKLDIANLERRRAEVETDLRERIAQAIHEYEAAERRLRLARAKLAAHTTRLKWLEAAYQLGEGETETMLTLWQQHTELQAQLTEAEDKPETITRSILRLTKGFMFQPTSQRLPNGQ